MKKKEKPGKIKGILEFVSDLLFPQIAKKASEYLVTIQDKAIEVKERVIKELTASIVLGMSFLFFMFAGFFALREYLFISRTIACLSVGGILLVLGLFLKVKLLKEK